MGWFWATKESPPAADVTQLRPLSAASPPPSCPMHVATPTAATPSPPLSDASACPYVPPPSSPSTTTSTTTTDSPTSPAPQPNAAHQSVISKLNPLNYMPTNLSNARAPDQTFALGLDRETSSIPKSDGSLWEYPSPQQMYNAMLRKGYTDTPDNSVESMVAVHNFLNEGAWAEIVEWERRFGAGLGHGLRASARGEDIAEWERSTAPSAVPPPKLARFMGRPGELTPKAQFMQGLGWLMPSTFNTEPPFDRHDWFVERTATDGSVKEVRYVIDYYSGPPEPTGEPVFFLDVRPAVDTPTAACERLLRWGGDIWWRGTGGSVREELARQKAQAQARS